MKTPDEIKESLGYCGSIAQHHNGCAMCPYWDIERGCRSGSMLSDALAYIRQLEERCKTLNQLRDAAAGRALKMEERVHQLEREQYVKAVDTLDQKMVEACIQAAQEEGVCLTLIDKKFIADAIREKMEREGLMDEQLTTGDDD